MSTAANTSPTTPRPGGLPWLYPKLCLRRREPETNGVVEPFNRTLKEKIIHGRTQRNHAELAAALATFVEIYNRDWRLEKLHYKSPLEARRDHQPTTQIAA